MKQMKSEQKSIGSRIRTIQRSRFLFHLATLLLLVCSLAATARSAERALQDVDIPYAVFRLDNGLTVVVHEDHKTPVVAVNLWYHVGSSAEPAGKTGYAHLFEHIMFNGSTHYNGDWIGPLTDVGATDVNGATSFDWTNYRQTVPTTALDRALWMESDRMIYLLGALDQAKLDEQRAVVRNEKLQGDSAPYGLLTYEQLKGIFPPGHPYRHPPIGSLEDLDRATPSDMHEWFNGHYGAANVVLSIAGDVTVSEAKAKVEKYFGAAPAGQMQTRFVRSIPDRRQNSRQVMQDRVPQPRIVRSWAVPGWISEDADQLELAASILGDGKNSRLYKKLVHELQVATGVAANLQKFEIASMFVVDVTLKPGIEPMTAERALDEVLVEFLDKGPNPREVIRAKTRLSAGLARKMEQVASKAAMLAESQLYGGSPGAWRQKLARQDVLTGPDLIQSAREWLSDGFHQITFVPLEQGSSAPDTVERKAGLPAVPRMPELAWPAIESGQLSNGIPVVFAHREAMPMVNVAVVFDAGSSAESAIGTGKAGLAALTMQALSEGTMGKDALELSGELEDLGAQYRARSRRDDSFLFYSALTTKFDETTALVAAMVREPDLPDDAIRRAKERLIVDIAQAKADPQGIAGRIMPSLLYGDEHPYGSRSVMNESDVAGLTKADVGSFTRSWVRPDNTVLVVVGGGGLADVLPVLNRHFGDWQAPDSAKPFKRYPEIPRVQRHHIVIVDRPGAEQTFIQASRPGPVGITKDEAAIDVLNEVLGGSFTSRLNMNLREQKGWSYGVSSSLDLGPHQRAITMTASVQTDKTADAMNEMWNEMTGLADSRPVGQEELTRAIFSRVRGLPARFETAASVMDSLVTSQMLQLPMDYPVQMAERYEALKIDDLKSIAREVLDSSGLIWVVVGDREKIEGNIRALNLGQVEVRDVE